MYSSINAEKKITLFFLIYAVNEVVSLNSVQQIFQLKTFIIQFFFNVV